MKYYAGIGSRETPDEIIDYFIKLGSYFAKKGYTLRSGHAKGADQAFEQGCDIEKGPKEIYLPWKEFEDSNSELIVSNPKAFKLAEKFHPRWASLKQGGQKLQARNSHQVLGQNLKTPSSFIICWTKGGKSGGGTGQAIRLAKAYNIPVFDAGKYKDVLSIRTALKEFLKEIKRKEREKNEKVK